MMYASLEGEETVRLDGEFLTGMRIELPEATSKITNIFHIL